MQRRKVLLPHPLGPSRLTNSAFPNVERPAIERRSRLDASPNRLTTSQAAIYRVSASSADLGNDAGIDDSL